MSRLRTRVFAVAVAASLMIGASAVQAQPARESSAGKGAAISWINAAWTLLNGFWLGVPVESGKGVSPIRSISAPLVVSPSTTPPTGWPGGGVQRNGNSGSCIDPMGGGLDCAV
jgi:hypothetical protein